MTSNTQPSISLSSRSANDPVSKDVIASSGRKLQEILPRIRKPLVESGGSVTLSMVRNALAPADVALLESFVYWARLFLAGFGLPEPGSYESPYLLDLLDDVDQQMEKAQELGLIDPLLTLRESQLA